MQINSISLVTNAASFILRYAPLSFCNESAEIFAHESWNSRYQINSRTRMQKSGCRQKCQEIKDTKNNYKA